VLDITDLKSKELRKEIEQLRNNLFDVIYRKGTDHKDTIQASRILDEKINEYHLKEKVT